MKITNRQYGYARVSTGKQNIERQVRNIQAMFPNAVVPLSA
jgi:DNA invertase Pin-like site-specific DNA recombinase